MPEIPTFHFCLLIWPSGGTFGDRAPYWAELFGAFGDRTPYWAEFFGAFGDRALLLGGCRFGEETVQKFAVFRGKVETDTGLVNQGRQMDVPLFPQFRDPLDCLTNGCALGHDG